MEDRPDDCCGEDRKLDLHRIVAETAVSLRTRGEALNVASGQHVADRVVPGEQESAQDHEGEVLLEDLHDGRGFLLLCLRDLAEHRGLVDGAADHETDDDEHHGEQERHAPAPLLEGVAGRDNAHECEHGGREQHAEGHTQLREDAKQAALPLGGVLDRHEDGTAPFTAPAERPCRMRELGIDRIGAMIPIDWYVGRMPMPTVATPMRSSVMTSMG